MKTLTTISAIITIAVSVIFGFWAFEALGQSESAVQQAAVGALYAALCIGPYVVTKSLWIMNDIN